MVEEEVMEVGLVQVEAQVMCILHPQRHIIRLVVY